MKGIKRIVCTMLCAVLLGGTLTGLAGCKDEGESSVPQTQTQPQTGAGELTLEQYSITLYEGETYAVTPKKTNAAGEAETIETIEYTSDRAYIASCENGVVTAVAVGQTYIHVTADGLNVSLFVTVKSAANQNDVFIRFMEERLYAGVPVQARVYTNASGVLEEVEGVTFFTDSETLRVSENGIVTPLQKTASATVKARCTVGGREKIIEKTIEVVEPFNYVISTNEVFIAGTKTYTGEENTKYTSSTLSVTEQNLLTGEERRLTGEELLLDNETESLCYTTIGTAGEVQIQSKDVAGKGSVFVQVKNSTYRFKIEVTVAYAISTIADMDKISLASLHRVGDLSQSYILTDDIDYNGGIVYPIALWRENNNRTLGMQWKYLLDYEDGKYAYVNRSKVGTADIGLTDEEWSTFASEGGINPKNAGFTGIFDGNGYAIKNAKLMYAPFITMPETEDYYGAGTSIFGYLDGGTIRNTEFDVTLQTVEDIRSMYSEDASKTLLNGQIIDFDWQIKNGNYQHFGSSIIFRAKSSTVYNVYAHVSLPNTFATSRQSAGLLGWGTDMTVYNNIAYVENNTSWIFYYGIQAEGNAKVFKNNLSVGVTTAGPDKALNVKSVTDANGQNGNWWTRETSFSALASLTAGSAAMDVLSYAQTLSSFDTTIWDISGLSANEAPTLLNGCSVR